MDFSQFSELLDNTQATINALITIGMAALFGFIGYLVLFKVLFRLAVCPDSDININLLRRWRHPAKPLLPLLVIYFILPSASLPPPIFMLLQHLGVLLLIISISWLLIATILGLRDLLLERYDLADPDNLKARTITTQVTMLVRISIVVVVALAGATMLMTFDAVRQVGVSLLASAGVAGVVIGFAAQRSLATLLAGIQIAITQPIRLDDVVIVEEEWGRVEEITLTYVVVRIWDLRRMVLPITYFLEKPFQNWTRASSDLLGVVFIHCDYRVPVDQVRGELERIVAATELWDGNVCKLMMTDAGERTVQLRAVVSAPDASTAFELRCHVREQLIRFLQREHPDSLPRTRGELDNLYQGGDRPGLGGKP